MEQHRGNVLVVDDEVMITQWIVELLSEEGYSVRIAHDGASALLAIREQVPDVVLLDIAMPVMAGDELLLRLRRGTYPELPIIVMTAGMNAEIYRSQGATWVLEKPIDLDTLLGTIARYAYSAQTGLNLEQEEQG